MQALTKHIILRMFIIYFHGDSSVALQHSNKECELYFPSVLCRPFFYNGSHYQSELFLGILKSNTKG